MLAVILGLVGVALGAALTWVREDWRERRTYATRAKLLAVKTVIALDTFIVECASKIGGEPEDDGSGPPRYDIPTRLVTPADVDWATIPPDLTYRILRIPVQCDEAAQRARWADYYGGWDDANTVVQEDSPRWQ